MATVIFLHKIEVNIKIIVTINLGNFYIVNTTMYSHAEHLDRWLQLLWKGKPLHMYMIIITRTLINFTSKKRTEIKKI